MAFDEFSSLFFCYSQYRSREFSVRFSPVFFRAGNLLCLRSPFLGDRQVVVHKEEEVALDTSPHRIRVARPERRSSKDPEERFGNLAWNQW